MLERVFHLALEHHPDCGCELKIIAAIPGAVSDRHSETLCAAPHAPPAFARWCCHSSWTGAFATAAIEVVAAIFRLPTQRMGAQPLRHLRPQRRVLRLEEAEVSDTAVGPRNRGNLTMLDASAAEPMQ